MTWPVSVSSSVRPDLANCRLRLHPQSHHLTPPMADHRERLPLGRQLEVDFAPGLSAAAWRLS